MVFWIASFSKDDNSKLLFLTSSVSKEVVFRCASVSKEVVFRCVIWTKSLFSKLIFLDIQRFQGFIQIFDNVHLMILLFCWLLLFHDFNECLPYRSLSSNFQHKFLYKKAIFLSLQPVFVDFSCFIFLHMIFNEKSLTLFGLQ